MKYFTVNDSFKSIIEKEVGEVESMHQISTGWTNFVYDVKTSNNEYIFRFPRNNFFSDVLKKEVSFSQYIKGKIQTPTTNIKLCFHNSRPFTCHEKIKGKSLTSVYPTLSLNDKEKIANQVSDFIYELQSIPLGSIPIELPTTSKFLAELSKVDDAYYDFSQHDNLINLENGSEMVLNHADLNPGNILIDEDNNVCAVIDFAFVSKSSWINDVSRLIGRLPQDFHEIMLDSYNQRFESDLTMDEINSLISVWNYVEEHYINYMKENQPEIDIGR